MAGCVETTSGALAGNSLGDFVFLMAFSRVLVAVEMALADAGLLTMLSRDTVVGSCDMGRSSNRIVEDIPLGSAGYVDDVVQPLMAPACEVAGKMKQCAGIYHHIFSHFGPAIAEALLGKVPCQHAARCLSTMGARSTLSVEKIHTLLSLPLTSPNDDPVPDKRSNTKIFYPFFFRVKTHCCDA